MVIWRTRAGEVVAYDDRCSHKRFPLSKGRLMPDGTLECAYHGMRYDTSGKCVMIPSHPTVSHFPARHGERLSAYRTGWSCVGMARRS